MNDNKNIPGGVVAALHREIKTRTEIVRTIADLEQQLDADRICGSWLSTENQLSAVIRRLGPRTWRAVIFDSSLCYKRVAQEAVVTLRRHRLYLGPDEGNRVVYDAASDMLTIGCYGRFVSEDAIARSEADDISAAEFSIDEAL